jgi:modification target Cys-rich repeat protein
MAVSKDDFIDGDLVNQYRDKLDTINPHNFSWADDVNLKDNKVIVKSSHYYDLRNRINFFASRPNLGTNSGCNGSCAGLCQGCGGTCLGTCVGSCTGSCAGSCSGTCMHGCRGCSDRWF